MRPHPDPRYPRGVRKAALVLAAVVAVVAMLVIAPTASAANTRLAAVNATPAASASASRAAWFAASGGPSERIVLAKADPCAALFGSVKQACENFGKSGSGSGGASVIDIPGQVEKAVDSWFGNLVKSALTPVLNLFGQLILATPDLTGGRVTGIWEITLGIADTVFVLLVVVGGVIVMSHETVQSRHGLKQVLPRLILGFLAANCSLLLVQHALTFGNALTLAVWDGDIPSGAGIGNQLLGTILTSIFLPDGVTQIFTVLFGLVLAVLALAVVFSLALRTTALVLLVVLAPPMLLCHAVPGLDAVALLWWRLLAAVLAIGFLQAFVLMLITQVFFNPDGNVLGIPTGAGLVDLLVCGALFVILLKIPGWVLRTALGRAPRSAVMGLVRTAATAAIGTAAGIPGAGSARMLAARLGGRAVSSRLGSAAPGPGTGRATGVRVPRPARAAGPRTRPDFGSARGRREANGQRVLFPMPPGTRRPPSAGQLPPAEPVQAETAPPTSGPGWFQNPIVPRPAAKPGPLTSGTQLTAFELPKGARLTRAQARQRLERLQPWRKAWYPEPEPTRSPYRQPALFNRKGHLHPDVKAAATPRPAPAPTQDPLPRTPPTRTSSSAPTGATKRVRSQVPHAPQPPAGAAPSAAGSSVPPAPPAPAPRLVPVRMAAAPTPKPKRRRTSRRGGANGGEQP